MWQRMGSLLPFGWALAIKLRVCSGWAAVVAASGLALIGSRSEVVVAADVPQALESQASGYQEALAAGQRILTWRRPQSALERPKIEFAAARQQFRKALELAQTDSEKAAALLAIGESRLHDCQETQYAAIREDFARVLTLAGAPLSERAQAALGIGETYVRETEYDRAREQFALARQMSDHPSITAQAQYALAYSYLQQRRPEDARREFSRLLQTARAGTPLAWRVRALLEGLERVPQIRPCHPRLFFNDDTWPAVKARALGPQKAEFDQMKIRVDRIPGENLRSKDWGHEVMDAAFVYRVTGDRSVLDKVRKLLRINVDFYLGRTVARGRMYPLLGTAAALDWVWNDLAPPERNELVRDMIHYVHTMDVEDQIQGGGLSGMLKARDYYVRSVPWYFGLAVFGEHLDDVSYGRAFTALGRGFWQYRGFGELATEAGRDDGAVRTALEYYFAETLTTFWQFLYCWESALGDPAPPELIYFLSPDYIVRNVLGLTRREWQPGRVVHFGYGNSWRPEDGMRGDLLYDHLGHILHFFGQSHPDQAALARHLRQRMEAAGVTGRGEYAIYPFLRDLDRAPPAAIPPNMPIARHFEYVGQILMSSGFGPEDTYALFSCGGNEDYGHFDATHFSIYKQGRLALDSGSRAQSQLWPGAPPGAEERLQGGLHYNDQTVAHNCVLIHMEGEEFPYHALNSGGQRRNPGDARLLAFETRGKYYAYAATDATPVYHEDKCARMVRQLIYLPPDHFVVFDRVTSKRAEYRKTWLLHTANEPLIAGREFLADQRAGRIFCRTLLPLDAVPAKIGGPGKEFWAAGRNWPIPADSPYLRHYLHTDRADNVPESLGRWRVEVQPGAPRTDDVFLHLIQASARTVTTMVESHVREQDKQVEFSFTGGSRTYTISLNKAGEVGGRIRIEEGAKTAVDQDLTREIQPQTGLALTN